MHIGLAQSSKEARVACSCPHLRARYSRLKAAANYANPQLISRSFSGNHALPGNKDIPLMSSGTASSPGTWGKMPGTPSGGSDWFRDVLHSGNFKRQKLISKIKFRKLCALT